MSWDAIGAVADVLGALGVIASLIYLALQIRQNTAGLSLSARQQLTHENTEYTKLLLTDSKIGALYARTNPLPVESMSNPLGLAPDELVTLVRLQYVAFANLENQYLALQSGLLSKDEWASSRALLSNVYLSSDASRDYWQTIGRTLHGPSFGQVVEEILAERDVA